MSTSSGLAPLLLTTLGVGALGSIVGSIVTTYGAQTRDRRQARAQAREAIRRVENAATKGTTEELDVALAEFEINAMIAGLPRRLAELYNEAHRTVSHLSSMISEDIEKRTDTRSIPDIGRRMSAKADIAIIASEAAELLVNTTWHPWYGAPHRRYRARKLRFALAGRGPQFRIAPEAKRMLKQWEREDIRSGKRFLRKR